MNIRDLAKLCGVSHTTVSMALRNDGRISPEVRTRVQAAALAAGYKPDAEIAHAMTAVARGAGYRAAVPIALLSPWPTRQAWNENWVLREFYLGLELRAREFAYKLEEFWLAEPGMTTRRIGDILRARGIEGVVVFNYVSAPARLELDLADFSAVVLGRALVSPRIPSVDHDHFQGLNVACDELARRGYARLGLLVLTDGHQANERSSHQWEAAYLVRRQSQRRADRIPHWVDSAGDPRGIRAWVERYHLDAVVGTSAQALSRLQAAGFSVPADLAYASLAIAPDQSACAGIDIRGREVGAAAIDLLVDQLRERRHSAMTTGLTLLVDGRWHDGVSVPINSGQLSATTDINDPPRQAR